MKNWHVLFVVVTFGMFLTSPRIANVTSQPEPQQQLRYDVRYSCNGDTIIVGHCRHDDDTRAFPPTKPDEDFCMVYYPDRPLQNGFRVQKVELLGDIIKRLQVCGAFSQPSTTRQPAALNRHPEAIAAFKEAIRIEPTKGRPHANLGNLYVFLNRNAEAVPELGQPTTGECGWRDHRALQTRISN